MANTPNNDVIPVNGSSHTQGRAYNKGNGYNQGNGSFSGLGQALDHPVAHGGGFAPGVGYPSNFMGFGFPNPTQVVPIVHIQNFYYCREPGIYTLSNSRDICQASIVTNGNAQPMNTSADSLFVALPAQEKAPTPKKKRAKKSNSAESEALEALANAEIQRLLLGTSATTTVPK